MRGRIRAALATGVLVTTIGSGAALALPVAAAARVAASRAAAPSRTAAEPMSPKTRLLQQQLATGRATRTAARPQFLSTVNCTSSWSTVISPNASAGRNVLTALAANAPNDMWGVGFYVNGSSVYQTLAEHWDGNDWSVIPTVNVGPGNNLFQSVTAISATDVWAVGYWRPGTSGPAQPLTEHWNGNGWTVIPAPLAPNSSTPLYSVSASASNEVWAVGISINYPGDATLGPRAHAYALHWNGSNWSSVATAALFAPFSGPGVDVMGLSGVKVLSPTNAWAVGDGQDYTGNTPVSPDMAFIEHWDGSSWSQFSAPTGVAPTHANGDFLVDVQGTANDLWAVGGKNQAYQSFADDALIEHWNGTSWAEVAAPAPSPAAQSANLFALGYVDANNVYAAGATASNPFTTSELDQTLIERWNGSTWSQMSSMNPSGNDGLVAVAAISTSDLWAAGFMQFTGAPQQTLTENLCSPPVVTNVTPSSGDGGTSVVITGTGFSHALDVKFGATPAFAFHVNSDTQITATSPGHKAGVVDIRVTVQATSVAASADQFTYLGSRSGPGAGTGKPFPGRTIPPPPTHALPLRPGAVPRTAPSPI